MRISKVVAIDPQSKEKQTFTFGLSSEGKEICTSKGGHLNSYLEFCFKEESENQKDVEVFFDLNGEQYSLARLHNEDGSTRNVLKKYADGRWNVTARNKNAVKEVEAVLQEQLSNMLKMHYVNNKAVENFHGDLMLFDEIRMLTQVKEEILSSSQNARNLKDQAVKRVQEFSALGSIPTPTPEAMDQLNADLDAVSRDITVATAQLGEMRARKTVVNIHTDIEQKLEVAQRKYKQLTEHQEEIEAGRERLKLRDDIAALVPKVRALQQTGKQRAEYEKNRYGITTELEWQENELASVNQQLEDKNRQYALTQDKRSRIENINAELSYVASMYEENKRLNEQLLDLNEKRQRLVSERTMYLNKLDSVEKSLGDVKTSLEAFHIPAKSVGELLETVRVDVKIDEVSSQIEKLQSELAVMESQIAEKESALVIQVKRFRSVAELDVAVTPIKAKDTILQVLDAKYSKLEAINQSLQEKQRNLERAMEDYRFRILQLEDSRSKLENERNKTLLRKQEEFKREVFLNSQKVYNDDASSVFAVTADFHDQEIEALEQEIVDRNVNRDQLVERAAALEGAIKEIKRHVDINAAEMATLTAEKENINNRYNEIVAQNSSETVFNYLKALNSDNGTKYLLDVQQDAVRGEAELAELKRNTESIRSKLSALRSRLRYLKETQSQLDSTQSSVDTLVSTNDKMKDNLTDIGERLSAGYEQYAAISRQLESINSKLDDLNAAITEITKTIKVNESQIAASTEKAKRFAGSDDLEQAVANFRYELGDVEDERQMLLDSKQQMEKDVFKKRLELEKAQWLYETKSREYDELYQELQFEVKLKGLDMDKIATMNLDDTMDELRRQIAEYDAVKANLAEKIDNYYNILKDDTTERVSDVEIEDKQREIDQLVHRKEKLEQNRQQQMQIYAAASTAKMRATAAAVEARTLSAVNQSINHSDIIGLLIADKIKSTLLVATQYFNAITGNHYVLREVDNKVVVEVGQEKRSYDDLDLDTKTAVYISLVLAVPNTDATAGRWLIFEERINVNKKQLSEMLLKMDNICYVVSYARQQPKSEETA